MSEMTGGGADKFGSAFERLWIVNLALDVVDGRATSIKWEALGPKGTGLRMQRVRMEMSGQSNTLESSHRVFLKPNRLLILQNALDEKFLTLETELTSPEKKRLKLHLGMQIKRRSGCLFHRH